ncbi:MAG: hypothetical protein NEHIOOID_00294 [Holosporales bacterium]
MNKDQTLRVIAIFLLAIVNAPTLSAMTAEDLDRENAAFKEQSEKRMRERREKLNALSSKYDQESEPLDNAIKKLKEQKKQTMQAAERMLDATEIEYEGAINLLLNLKNKSKSLSERNLIEINHFLTAIESGTMNLRDLKQKIQSLFDSVNH